VGIRAVRPWREGRAREKVGLEVDMGGGLWYERIHLLRKIPDAWARRAVWPGEDVLVVVVVVKDGVWAADLAE